MSKKRLSSEERRENIIQSARVVFSEKGFHGTTTRELATCAGVSEALLFRHFPSKEAIYAAMLKVCMKSEAGSEAQKLLALKPSTSSLTTILHFILGKSVKGDREIRMTHKLLLRSLGEDGAFARVVFKHVAAEWIPMFRACLRAAKRAGDLRDSEDALKNAEWLAQHLALMVALMHAPTERTVHYPSSAEVLVRDTVVFCLRGLGVSEEAIARAYNPKAFELFAESF